VEARELEEKIRRYFFGEVQTRGLAYLKENSAVY
jgi:hypothetical protein